MTGYVLSSRRDGQVKKVGPPNAVSAQKEQEMLCLSVEPRFIFIHVPKTAGTALTDTLEQYICTPKSSRFNRIKRRLPFTVPPEQAFFKGHDTAALCRRKLGPAVYDSFLSFAVVRNPFDHAISLYTFLKETENEKLRSIVSGMTFDEHLEYRLRRPMFDLAPWFARMPDQSHFVCDRAGRILVDRILYFETLTDDIDALFSELGLESPILGRARETKGRDRGGSKLREVQEWFSNAATVDKAVKLHSRDFAAFGYRTDTSDLAPVFRVGARDKTAPG